MINFCCHHFIKWSTGRVDLISTLSNDSLTVNPTLVFTKARRSEFSLDLGTNPIMGFHISSELLKAGAESTMNEETRVSIHYQVLETFKIWCQSFRSLADSWNGQKPRIRIRFFAGDSIDLCSALVTADFQKAHFQFGKLSPLCLDGGDYTPLNSPNSSNFQNRYPAPTRFHVIESHSLADHFGLVNVLAATSQLLILDAASALHTSLSLPSTCNTLEELVDIIDPVAIGVFLQIMPISTLSGTFDCFLDKARDVTIFQGSSMMMSDSMSAQSLRKGKKTRIMWKNPFMGDPHGGSISGTVVKRSISGSTPQEVASVSLYVIRYNYTMLITHIATYGSAFALFS
jgi:hypothetical protein